MKKFTLKELERMNVTQLRQVLKEQNKTARGKASRLKRAGFSGEMTTPPIKDYQRTPRTELVRAIADLQMYNKSKLSTVKGMKEFERGTLTTLKQHGYSFVDSDNLADFGRFMNMVRDLYGEKGFPSRQVAQLYEDMERLNISNNVMREKFSEFLSTDSGIMDLSETLNELDLPENRKRVTSTEVLNKMGDLGLL